MDGATLSKSLIQFSVDGLGYVPPCCLFPPPETPGHSRASLTQSLVGTLLLSPDSWCAQDFVCSLQETVEVLWKFQIPLVSKVKFIGGSQIPRFGNLLWVLELS